MSFENKDIFKTFQLNKIIDIFYIWGQFKVEYYAPKKIYLLFWHGYIVYEIENISLIPNDIISGKTKDNHMLLLIIKDFFLKISNPDNLDFTNIREISSWNLNKSLNINLIEINYFTKIINNPEYLSFGKNIFLNKVYFKYKDGDILPNWYNDMLNKKFKNYNDFNPNSWILVTTPGAGPKHIITPLIDACFKGDVEMVKMLLSLKANPNICCSDGWSPIMEAVFARNQDEQNYIDIIALLVLYKANPWPGGEFISCRDGSTMTKLEDVPPVNCPKLRLFCSLITLGVPINGDPLAKNIFDHLPPEFENFKKESLEIAKSIYVPRSPNLFRILPGEITKNILEITLGYNIHLIIKQMISPGILNTI